MKIKSSLRRNTRFSEEKILKILECFCNDFRADFTAKYLNIDCKTINDWYMYVRKAIYWYEEEEKKVLFNGTVEVDESYFGPKRIRGKRGRQGELWSKRRQPRLGAGGKTIVFGLLERDGKVYTELVSDTEAKSLIPIIRGKVDSGSEINTDGWRAYDGLVDIGFEKHYRVHHGENEFARGKQHINGIESFWSFTKRRFVNFNGIKKEFFHLYLKESEYRYNVRISGGDLYKNLLKILRNFNP